MGNTSSMHLGGLRRQPPNPPGSPRKGSVQRGGTAGPETRQDIIDRLYPREYDVETMMRGYIRRRRGE